MKSQERKKARLLRELENNPLIERACKRVGIARSTYYRWCEQDTIFAQRANIAQEQGRAKLNDFVESKLLENINDNQQQAIAFWLSHNTSRYRHPTTQYHAYKEERMKQGLWARTEMLNNVIDILGMDRFLRLAGREDYQQIVEEIDNLYEQDQINRGFRGKHDYRPPENKHIPYPDDIDFGV